VIEITDDKKKKPTSKFHKGDELKVCQCTGLAFEHIVKDHFNHSNEELKNMYKLPKKRYVKLKEERNIAMKKVIMQ
jgi:hypothetical protein